MSNSKISVFYDHLLQAAQQTGKSVEEMLSYAKTCGIDAVEIRLTCFTENKRILEQLKESELRISCIYEFYEMDKHDEAEHIKEHIEKAKAVGAEKILVVPGFLGRFDTWCFAGKKGNYNKLVPFMDRNKSVQGIVNGLKYAVRIGTERSIIVSVEDFDSEKSPLCCINGVRYFLEHVPGLKYTLDTGNFAYIGEDVLEAWEVLQGYVAHVHCKDRGEKLSSVATGSGRLPMAEIVSRLQEKEYGGYYAIEHFDVPNQEEAIKCSAEFLKGVLNEM